MVLKASQFNNVVRYGGKFLYHNTLTGSLIAVDARTHRDLGPVLKGRATVGEYENRLYIDLLKKNGFLIDSNVDEIAFCRTIHLAGKHASSTLTVTLILSYDCDFACDYCFQRLSRETWGVGDTIDSAVFTGLCSFLDARLDDLEALDVTWMGGEPLLQLDRIERYAGPIRELCAKHTVRFANLVITNGYALDQEAIAILKRELPNLRVQVTLDGPPGVHDTRRPHKEGLDTFPTILGNVEACIREDVPVYIRVNVDERNAPFMPTLFEYLDNSLVAGRERVVHLAKVDPNLTATDDIHVSDFKHFSQAERTYLSRHMERPYLDIPSIRVTSGCMGLGDDYIIDPGGGVFKCPRYMEQRRFQVGSLLEDPIINDGHVKWQSWNPLEQAKCRECNLLPVCMGGCPFAAIHKGGESTCGDIRYTYKNRVVLSYLRAREVSST